MTDIALTQSRFATAMIDDKAAAFVRASRHSRRVRWLRRLILLTAIGLCVGVVIFAFFNPFRALVPDNVSIEGAGLSGSRVTMAKPKMSGFRKDGRPYDFVAETAVQDLKAPNLLELNKLDAHVTMSDRGVAHVVADTGLYDTSKEIMDLKGNIRITSDSGYDITMHSAHIEFQGSNVISHEPVTVVMKTGTVASDSMQMSDNGAHIVFDGNVKSVMLPAGATVPSVAPLRSTAP